MSAGENMKFKSYGRSYHLRIETAEDLRNILELDEAHWVATNAPVDTMNCDRTFLKLMDTDNNGRVMCLELEQEISWLLNVLGDYSGMTPENEALKLEAINTDSEDGARIRDAARKILAKVGEPDSGEVTLDQVRWIKTREESASVSEVGVVLPQAADDEEMKQFIQDIIDTVGGADHPSGEKGVGQTQLDQFLADSSAYLDWYRKGLIPSGAKQTDINPFGDDTTAAYKVLASVRGKIDQYFAQCEAAALDESFVQRMGWTEEELKELDFDDPEVIEKVLIQAPVARAKPDRILSFSDSINPYYSGMLKDFRQLVMKPVLGKAGEELSALQWQEIKDAFKPYKTWYESKPGISVGPLGVEKLERYQDKKYTGYINALVAESGRTAFVLDNIRLAEKLILYQKYMIELANNFVSFPNLYDPERRAMFEMGTLIMDGRRFNLAVKVEDRAKHARVAASSNLFVLYAEVAQRDLDNTYVIAVPVTSGGKGNLCIGKSGVFYDLNGKMNDAMIVNIIENPISIGEAIVSPFKRLGKMLTGKIESIASSAEKKFETRTAASLDKVAPAKGVAATPVQPPSQQAAGASTGNLLMGGSVAIAALGSAAAFITKTLAQTGPLQIIFGILTALFLVMLPMSIVAFRKLRKQDISAILEGSGWAVNARMRLTRGQRKFFTRKPFYPKGARTAHMSLRYVGIIRFAVKIFILLVIATGLSVGGYYLHKYLKKIEKEKAQNADTSVQNEGRDNDGTDANSKKE